MWKCVGAGQSFWKEGDSVGPLGDSCRSPMALTASRVDEWDLGVLFLPGWHKAAQLQCPSKLWLP